MKFGENCMGPQRRVIALAGMVPVIGGLSAETKVKTPGDQRGGFRRGFSRSKGLRWCLRGPERE